MRRIARNPEVVVVANPAITPLFGKGTSMKKRAKRKSRKGGRKHSTRKHAYKGKKGGRKLRRRRKSCCAYANFAKAQWRKHRAHFKKIGFRRAGKAIAAAWKKAK